jgi:hypothetical protein
MSPLWTQELSLKLVLLLQPETPPPDSTVTYWGLNCLGTRATHDVHVTLTLIYLKSLSRRIYVYIHMCVCTWCLPSHCKYMYIYTFMCVCMFLMSPSHCKYMYIYTCMCVCMFLISPKSSPHHSGKPFLFSVNKFCSFQWFSSVYFAAYHLSVVPPG